MRKPTAKQAHKAVKPKKPLKPKKPTAKKVKPAKTVKPKKPVKAKGHATQHHLSRFSRRTAVTLPATDAAFIDLATDPAMPPITDQGGGSCIAHASLAMFGWATAKGLDHNRVTPLDVASVQACLTAGAPVVAGVMVCGSFTHPTALASGVVTPARRERTVDGHYLLLVGIGYGYEWAEQFPAADPAVRYVKVRNSWGADVYRGGYLLLPLAYVERYATELWTVG